MMNQLFGNSLLFGGNAPFVEELYENYLDNPGLRLRAVARVFRQAGATCPVRCARCAASAGDQCLCRAGEEGRLPRRGSAPVDDKKQVSVLQMITAYRFIG
jgi:2-oxoglutarate dehydrogenase E1 component